MNDPSVWAGVDYAVDLDTYQSTIPCFNCGGYNTDFETGLCRDKCQPLTSLNTCKGNICPAIWTPDDIEEF